MIKKETTLADEYYGLFREFTRFAEQWESKFEALMAKHEKQDKKQKKKKLSHGTNGLNNANS